MNSDGFGQRAADQAQEGLAARAVGDRHAQQRAEEGIDDLRRLERRAGGLGFQFVEHAQALLVEQAQAAVEDRLEQVFLAAEVVVDGGQIDPASLVIWRIEAPS